MNFPRSSLFFLLLGALSATSASAFELRALPDDSGACPVSALYEDDPSTVDLLNPAGFTWSEDKAALPRLMGWMTDWSNRAVDFSDLPADKSRICVGIYQDLRGNARATGDMRLVYGIQKYRQLSGSRFDGEKGWSAQAILAHELGHLLQYAYQLKFDLQRTGERRELEADCVAGFLMEVTLRPLYLDHPEKYREPLKKEFYWMGDMALWEEQHHGTMGERQEAFTRGLNLGEQALASGALPMASRKIMDACEHLYPADPH